MSTAANAGFATTMPDVTVEAVPADARAVGRRRFVAVALTTTELLRPGSDLARFAGDAPETDLLLVADERPVSAPSRLGVLPVATSSGAPLTVVPPLADEDPEDEGITELPDLPGMRLHRLGLRLPLGASAESDVVAALSELVGFDPEPGVYFLAPEVVADDPATGAVERAVRRIARVYGLPLLRYRRHELNLVPSATA